MLRSTLVTQCHKLPRRLSFSPKMESSSTTPMRKATVTDNAVTTMSVLAHVLGQRPTVGEIHEGAVQGGRRGPAPPASPGSPPR